MLIFTSRVIAWFSKQRYGNIQRSSKDVIPKQKKEEDLFCFSAALFDHQRQQFLTQLNTFLRKKLKKKKKIQTRGSRSQDARTSLSWITSATHSGNFKPQFPALGESFRDDQSLPPKPLEGTMASLQVQQKQFFAGEHHYLAWVPGAMVGFPWEATFYRKQRIFTTTAWDFPGGPEVRTLPSNVGVVVVVQVWTLVGELRSDKPWGQNTKI